LGTTLGIASKLNKKTSDIWRVNAVVYQVMKQLKKELIADKTTLKKKTRPMHCLYSWIHKQYYNTGIL
jgi:hypothetical protein